jgi:hypothetical protein
MKEGGSYLIEKEGAEPALIERTEVEHFDGGARDATGRRLDGKGAVPEKPKAGLKVVRGKPLPPTSAPPTSEEAKA